MPRKFINRTNRDSSDVSAEDEWAHLTNNEEGPVLEIKDAMDTQDRNIIFSKNQEPKTTFEKVKEGTRNAMDAAGNTGQYIKFVSQHIDNQKKEIDKIKKIKEKFDQEVELLQSHNPNLMKLDVDSLENFDIKTVSKYLQQLLQEKGFTKEKLNNLKGVIENVEGELENQENQIEGLNQELNSKQIEDNANGKNPETIKTELKLLAEKFGIDNLSNVFDIVKSAKSSKNEK